MRVFFSHPGFPLKEHLKDVGERCREITESLPLDWHKQRLKEIAYIIGICHDFGKYTTFFQKHLLEGEKNERSRHAFLSAVFTAWSLLKKLDNRSNRYVPLLAFFLVFHHHTNLTYPEDDIPLVKYLENPPRFPNAPDEPHPHRTRLTNAYLQIEDIKRFGLSAVEDFYEGEESFPSIRSFLDGDWINTLRELRKLWRSFQGESEEVKLQLFWLLLILYSTLLDADKKSAVRLLTRKPRFIPSNLVELYRDRILRRRKPHPLDSLREGIHTSVLKKIESVSLNEHLFSLTAPTGSGKTLTALACALKLRERIEKEKGYSPRIIYALPFINIIEQNYQVFREALALGLPDFEKNEHNYLIAHHHLAEICYREEEMERTPEEAYHLIEAWASEIVVTTFVQLFYSILGYKNSFLRKFHNIVGSIILLDEVQSVPVEYWEVIGQVLCSLAQYLNCYIVLLTATQPFILPAERKVELVEEHKQNFKGLNRITLHFSEKERNLEEIIEWLKTIYQPNYSYLFVVNTIPTSIELYWKIKESLKPRHLFYLSTNIIPKQRKERIREIKALLEKEEKPFLVSTQVVEAGVDLDFDIAIRDIGPIDSLVQVAGRCNREGKKTIGKVFICRLDHEASKVYRQIHISTALEVLRAKVGQNNEVREEELMELVELFFSKIKYKVSTEESKKILEAILDLRFSSKDTPGIEKFELIKEDIPEVEIFVEMDERAENVWKQFIHLKDEKDLFKRRELFLVLRKDFYDYVVAVPRERAQKNCPPLREGPYLFIPREQVGDFYCEETGFKCEPELAIW